MPAKKSPARKAAKKTAKKATRKPVKKAVKKPARKAAKKPAKAAAGFVLATSSDTGGGGTKGPSATGGGS